MIPTTASIRRFIDEAFRSVIWRQRGSFESNGNWKAATFSRTPPDGTAIMPVQRA